MRQHIVPKCAEPWIENLLDGFRSPSKANDLTILDYHPSKKKTPQPIHCMTGVANSKKQVESPCIPVVFLMFLGKVGHLGMISLTNHHLW